VATTIFTVLLYDIKDTAAGLSRLDQWYKSFHLQVLKRGMAYDPGAEPVKQYIEGWIDTETRSVKEREKLQLHYREPDVAPGLCRVAQAGVFRLR